ncbi:MAG: hypothetical protein WBX03_02750 [Terriglobales bacterium]|jgi:hypothetical protein
MKTEVYSWRLSPQRKAELESEARRGGTSLAKLLEQITGNWLEAQRKSRNGDEAEQAAIRKRMMATVGTIRGGDPTRSQRASELVREIIRQKHEKESNAFRRTD